MILAGILHASIIAQAATVTYDVIALDGDAAPGTAGVLDLSLGVNDDPPIKIDDSGRVYFFSPSTDFPHDGIWAGSGAGLETIVVDGQTLEQFAPTVEECDGVGPLCGHLFNTQPLFFLTQTGVLVLRTTREDITGTVAYLAGNGNADLTPMLTDKQTPDFPYSIGIALATEAGQYLVGSFLGSKPFGEPDGGLTDFAAALVGAAAPGIPDPVTISAVFGTQTPDAGVIFGINQDTDLLFAADLSDGTEALYFYPAARHSAKLLARGGDEPPGIPGAAFVNLITSLSLGRTGTAAITDLSDGFFMGTWRFPDQPLNNNNLPRSGIWRFDDGAVPALVVSAYLNPFFDVTFNTSEGPNIAFDTIVLPRIAPNGDVYFYGLARPVDEDGYPDRSDERRGLWRAAGGAPLELVLRVHRADLPGTPLPGGGVFQGLGYSGYGFDRDGRLVFTTSDALYAEDATGALQRVIESGQAIQVAPEDTRVVDRFLLNPLGLVGGVSESFRNGRLALSVRFDDGSFAVMRATLDDPCRSPPGVSGVMAGPGSSRPAEEPVCPAGDLIVSDFTPVQAIESATRLIKNKNTVFKATIESNFSSDQMVEIEISEEGSPIITETVRVIANCRNTYYFPNVTNRHLSGDCSNDSKFISDQSYQLTNAGSRFFKFKLDPGNKIAETSESNNLNNKIKTVVEVNKQFKIVYKTITNLDEAESFPPDEGLAGDIVGHSVKYLKNFLPVPEANVSGGLIDESVYALKMTSETDPQKKQEQLQAEIRDYLKQLADDNKAAVAVGLFRAGGFINPIAGDASAYSYTPTDGVRNKDVVNIMTTARDGLDLYSGAVKIAHEVLHTYDWVSAEQADPNSGRHFLKDADIDGYFHQPNRRSFEDARNLMQTAVEFSVFPAPVYVPHVESYDHMLDQFLNGEVDPPVIYMRGWIESDGAVVDLPSMRKMGFVDLPPGLTAEFKVEYFDAGNSLLAQTGFGPTLVNGEPDSPTTFFYNIGDVPGTTRIVISKDGEVLVEKSISDHSPSVDIIEPDAGDLLVTGQSVTLRWTSSDIDGDSLFHSVSLSTDAGESWDIVALDLVEKEITLTIPDDPNSSAVTFKVIASDGVNVGEDTKTVPTVSKTVFFDGFE